MPDYTDLVSPHQFRLAVGRVAALGHQASDADVAGGLSWFPDVRRAARRSGREAGLTAKQSYGITAAVSPNMDWEQHNIRALGEIADLRPREWQDIHASAAAGTRHPDVAAMLAERAPGAARAPDRNLLKAHRILGGEDPDTVLDRRSAPKTHSFYHGIRSDASPHVTIDGRMADVIAGSMRPWEQKRGINSAMARSGAPTLYERHEEVVRRATGVLQRMDPRYAGANPNSVQGAVWTAGKSIEMSGLTNRGQPRKVGPRRVGQPYLA